MLQWVLDHAKRFAITIFAILCGVYTFYGFVGAGVEFFPEVEPDQAQIRVRARGNLSVYEKHALVQQVQARFLDMKDEIRVFYTRSGQFEGGGGGESYTEDTVGVIQAEFSDWKTRRKASEILEEVRERTKDIPGIIIEMRKERKGPASGKPIQLEVGSRFPELIEPALKRILEGMEALGGFTDITDSRPVPAIEWEMAVDREKAARFGVDIGMVGQFIKLATNGIKVTDYRPDDADDEVDVMVRFPEDKRDMKTLDSVRCR
jgi:multidrug efflux pump